MQCPVCDNEFRSIGNDYQGIPIYKCSCGMGASGLSNQDFYTAPDRYDTWDGQYSPDGIEDNQNFLEIIKTYCKGNALLDVGTGSGCLPYLAKSQGFNAEGTDISKNACKVVWEKNRIRMHCGVLEELQFEIKYDIVSMVHLLEHTDNPLTTLKKATSLLTDQGMIFLVVPNCRTPSIIFKNYFSRTGLKTRPYKHLSCFHHKWFFTMNTLIKLGQKINLVPVYKITMCASKKRGLYYSLMQKFDMSSWLCVVFQ